MCGAILFSHADLRCGLLAEGVHDGAELLGADGAVPVLVEQGEGLPELGGLLLCEMVRHYSVWAETYCPPNLQHPGIL